MDMSTVLQLWHDVLHQSPGSARCDKRIIIVEQKRSGRQTCGGWSDPNSKTGAQHWRDEMRKFVPEKSLVVIELQGAYTWSVFAPKESHGWLHKYLNSS